MRTIVLLLLTLTIGFACPAQTVLPIAGKPKVKIIYNNRLLELTTKELSLQRLRKIYGKALRVSKVSRNIHDPTVRDTLLAVNTEIDKLEIFTNKYNSFLLKGEIVSQKIAFGKGVRVGTAKSLFCKAFGLPATFDGYLIADSEGGSSIYFLFRQGVLARVSYDVGWVD